MTFLPVHIWSSKLRRPQKPHARLRKSAALLLEQLENRLAPSATYYVSPSGDDSHDGRSPETAWQTIAKVNAHSFVAGDTIRFEGGASFTGGLQLFNRSGTSTNPITFNSYGTGRATINSGIARGFWFSDVSGVNISDLNFVGAGVDSSNVSGISYWSNASPVSHFYVDRVDISGYGIAGIDVIPVGTMDDVHIAHATLHHNGSGIFVDSGRPMLRVVSNLYIGYTEAYSNEKRGGPISGFGFLLNNINGGMIERSLIHDNGLRYGFGNDAIVVADSDNVTIQYNESYGNDDPSGNDGGSFVFFDGVTDSRMQYNYSHNNGGVGFTLQAEDPPSPNSWNTIRYNISENDRSGIYVTGRMDHAEIYNNTLYASSPPDGFSAAVIVGWFTGAGLHIRNNILETAGNSVLIVTTRLSGSDLLFQDNAYHAWDTRTCQFDWLEQCLDTLSDWRNATGQEMLDGQPAGYEGDPQLVDAGHGGTIGDPDRLYTLTAYQLQATSPVATLGLDLAARFSIDPGTQDFYGNLLSSLLSFSIGAHQIPELSTRPSGGTVGPPAPVGEYFARLAEVAGQDRLPTIPLSPVDPPGGTHSASYARDSLDLLFARASERPTLLWWMPTLNPHENEPLGVGTFADADEGMV